MFIFHHIIAQPILAVSATVLTAIILWYTKTYLRLSHIPGPFVSNFTDIPRFLWVLSYRAHEKHIQQHRKYGPIVRFGPNMVSVGAPAEISTIYRFSKPWKKVSLMVTLCLTAVTHRTAVRVLSGAPYEAQWKAYPGHICYPGREDSPYAQETCLERLLDDNPIVL